MFKLKGRKKILFSMILIVTVVMMQLSFVTLAAPNSNSVEMSIEAGYENLAKVGANIPVYITLENKGEGFSGEAQVIVDTGYRIKKAYAVNFDLPEGSTKKLTFNVPIRTASRKIRVKIESNGHTIKDMEHSINKVLSPETPVIGVLGEAYDQLRILESMGVKLWKTDDEMQKLYGTQYDGAGTIVENPAKVIQLNEDILPHDLDALSAFNYLVIADYDTSLLSDEQIRTLENWLNGGKTLIVVGGTNVKKVYSGLSDFLKPFEISENKKESIAGALEQFSEKGAPDSLVDVSAGKIGNGKILIGDETTPLAVSYKKGQGELIFVAFDPTMGSIATWEYNGTLWKGLINDSIQAVDLGLLNNVDYYRYETVVYQVPEDQAPPYKVLLMIILIYIIIVGPLLYIILKRKDKRDYSWVLIPALSLLFIGVIYAVGFRTRYTSAVSNNFSIINLDSDSKAAEIKTYSGVFSNKAGNMLLEYSKDYKVDVLRQNERYYGYNYNSFSDDDYENAQINSKIYQNDPVRYEIYNVGLWEPCILTTSQTQNYEGNVIKSVNLNGNKISVELINDTGFALEEAFIVVGENYVEVGNLLPNEEKTISFSMTDNNIYKSFYSYLEAKYPNTWSTANKGWREERRKRSALDSFNSFTNNSMTNSNLINSKVAFIALNFENVDYGITVNGKKTKAYNTNIVLTTKDLFFETGKTFDIPKGVLGAIFEGGENVVFRGGSYGGMYDDGITVVADTEIFYKFEIPKDMTVDSFVIDWTISIPEYLKEMYNQGSTEEGEFPGARYDLFVFNNAVSDWEIMKDVFEVKEGAQNYLNDDNTIKVKIKVDIDESMGKVEQLWKPQISVSGVKKDAGN